VRTKTLNRQRQNTGKKEQTYGDREKERTEITNNEREIQKIKLNGTLAE
jgi:hypothetical protein